MRVALLLCVLFLTVGCGSESVPTQLPAVADELPPPPPPPPPVTATMAPASAAVDVGNSVVFAVNASGGVPSDTASWTCAASNTGIATVSIVSAGCQATGVGLGDVTITATVTKSGETVNVGAQLTVTGALTATISSATHTVGVGNMARFHIVISGGEAGHNSIDCTSSDEGIAMVNEVGSDYCLVTGVSNGEVTITAIVISGDRTAKATAQLVVKRGYSTATRLSPATIGDTVIVRADRFFNGAADLRFVLLGVDIQPLPDRPDLLWATATMDVLLIEAHSRFFTAPISPLNWSSWSLSQSGQECFYGFQDGLTGMSLGPEPLPIAVGTNWTTDVSVFIPAEASSTAIELLAFQARAPEFFTLGNCFGPDPSTSERSGEAWFLLRGGAR